MTNNDIRTIAFVGLGIMGLPMAGHLLAGGKTLHIFTRTRRKAEPLIAAGAIWHDSPGEAVAGADAVVTMLGNPQDVESVYLGPNGLLSRARPGTVFVDATTSSPALAVKVAEAAAQKGLFALDAPVSGGEVGARAGKLAIMVGGDEAAFTRVLPILQMMGTNIVHQGPAGAGQHAKACNQIVIAGTIMGAAEGLAYASRNGLDPAKVLGVMSTGAAGGFILNVLGPKMIARDYAPGFFVEHFLKDLTIACEAADAAGLDLKGLEVARSQFRELMGRGHGRESTHVIYEAYDPR